MGAAFRWVKPDVYPLIATMAIAVGFCTYSIGKNLITNPDVHVAKSSRLEGIDETQRTADQAKAYTNNVYRGLAGPVPRIFR